MGNNLNDGNYKVALEYVKNQFKNSNPSQVEKLSNSIYDFNTSVFNIKFMNHNLNVKYPTGEIFYENLERLNSVEIEILILRYLVNSKGVPISEKYITYKEIDGGYVYYPNFEFRTLNAFIKKYGKNLEAFDLKMKKCNAEKLNLGDCSYKVRFINDVYVIFVLWEGDEELEPSGNILFDSNINYYFDAEDLAVIPDILLINL